jgi:hypothetical protein
MGLSLAVKKDRNGENDLIKTGIAVGCHFYGWYSQNKNDSAAGPRRHWQDPNGHGVHLSRNNENGLIVVFETSPDKLVRDAVNFGWDLPALERQNRLRSYFNKLFAKSTWESVLPETFGAGISALAVSESSFSVVVRGVGCDNTVRSAHL